MEYFTRDKTLSAFRCLTKDVIERIASDQMGSAATVYFMLRAEALLFGLSTFFKVLCRKFFVTRSRMLRLATRTSKTQSADGT